MSWIFFGISCRKFDIKGTDVTGRDKTEADQQYSDLMKALKKGKNDPCMTGFVLSGHGSEDADGEMTGNLVLGTGGITPSDLSGSGGLSFVVLGACGAGAKKDDWSKALGPNGQFVGPNGKMYFVNEPRHSARAATAISRSQGSTLR